MQLDTIILPLVEMTAVILIFGIILHRFKQPHVIAYLLAGAILGPHGLKLVGESASLSLLGEIGVVLLLFFVGMDLCIPCLVARWRVPIIGTLLQIGGSIAFMLIIDRLTGNTLPHSILFGFIIALSSTAVVIKILENTHEIKSKIGQNVIGILIMQDLAVIPMLIILNILGGDASSFTHFTLPLIGGLILMAVLVVAILKKEVPIPFSRMVSKDKELRVFGALLLCFGMALFTSVMGLSAALGAFVAGVIIASRSETHWVTESLNPFRIVFVGLFFVYIGMIIDLSFILPNLTYIMLLVIGVLITNTLINAGVVRMLGHSWNESFYSGALLAQIGEFSLVLAAIGRELSLLAVKEYQVAMAVIAISLLLSPFWISLMSRFTQKKCIISFT